MLCPLRSGRGVAHSFGRAARQDWSLFSTHVHVVETEIEPEVGLALDGGREAGRHPGSSARASDRVPRRAWIPDDRLWREAECLAPGEVELQDIVAIRIGTAAGQKKTSARSCRRRGRRSAGHCNGEALKSDRWPVEGPADRAERIRRTSGRARPRRTFVCAWAAPAVSTAARKRRARIVLPPLVTTDALSPQCGRRAVAPVTRPIRRRPD